MPCPAGITVAELLVLPGEQVQAGQAIARFDEEEVERLLARAKVQMKKLAAQKQSQADAGRQPDAGGVGSAQQALDWAYEDLRAAQDELARLQAAPETDAAALAAAQQAVQSATRTAQTAEAARDSALAAYQQAKQQAAAAAQSGGANIADLELDERETQQTIDDLAGLQADGCVLKAPAAGALLSWNMAAGGASTSPVSYTHLLV